MRRSVVMMIAVAVTGLTANAFAAGGYNPAGNGSGIAGGGGTSADDGVARPSSEVPVVPQQTARRGYNPAGFGSGLGGGAIQSSDVNLPDQSPQPGVVSKGSTYNPSGSINTIAGGG